ncbi:phospholipase D-like domain-containing protein [Pedobacter suwonensis]|uniref:phospholipase D-like domain-containing protein n=1 Tax=Pedobacter suwonensis TaxID=332999 RepID=UPI00119E053B|nr:phospholipase D-like domain-containing protein [Pedobacter suwonensis]
MKIKAYFGNIKNEIVTLIKSAEHSVRVAVAWLTDEDLIRELTTISLKGITVTVILSNSEQNFIYPHRFRKFLESGGSLYVCTTIFMHHKFCLVDNNYLINGSYNWSYTARNSEENIIVIDIFDDFVDTLLFKQFSFRFEKIKNEHSLKVDHYSNLNSITLLDKEKVLDPEETRLMELHKKLEEAIQNSITTSRKIGVPLNYDDLQARIIRDGGGANFIHRILREEMGQNEMKSGFRKLEEFIPHKVELSLEYLVCIPEYRELFTKEESDFCLKLMKKYDFFLNS